MSRGYVNATPAIAAVAGGNSISAMLQDPGITVIEVARCLGVAASTLYRQLPRARTAALDA
jgi:transposase-like protein